MLGQGEFAIIAQHFSQGFPKPRDLGLGIGDDASVVNLDACQLIQSLDTQVENIHFLANAPASLIAERALRCAVSDLSAMGAKPLSFHLSLSLPAYAQVPSWLSGFAGGLKKAAHELSIGLIGGDTTSSHELVIAILVQGILPKNQPALTRSKAQVGDDIWLSGAVGLAQAALEEDLVNVNEQALSKNASAYYRPEVHLSLGHKLLEVASACIDVSDGLMQDAQHIAQCSNVSLELDGNLLASWLNLDESNFWPVLTGGDDYQLLFCASQTQRAAIEQLQHRFADIVCIGQVKSPTTESVSLIQPLGERPKHLGFQHF